MNKRQISLFMIIAVLLLVCAMNAAAVNIGETIPIEGIVDSAGRNSLYVSGKILVANEYSSISTGGTNIYIGDYVMGFVYLNEDKQSYTIVSLTKIPERSVGTPPPLPSSTATPVWADLFTATPESGSELHLLSDTQEDNGPDRIRDMGFFGAQVTMAPTATQSSISFEGTVTGIDGNKIYIDGMEYITDNATGYKNGSTLISADGYVRGRAAPYPGALIIRYIEILEDYERPDLESETVWGLYQGQDSAKMIVSSPSGEVEALFYPGTKMSKTFYTKGALISMDMTGSYVKSSTDYPLVQSGDTLSPINGIIDEIVYFSENEIYFVSSGLSYFVNGDVKFLPDRNSFEKGSPFVGLMRNGRVAALYFTDNNRVKTINGTAASVDRNPDRNSIDFIVGGIKYHITPDSIVVGNNLVRYSEISGYSDSSNNVFYMVFTTPWYAQFKDWNWTVIVPAGASAIALLFFLLLHRTKTEGFLQDVSGTVLTLTDSRGEHKRHFRCTDEIARFAGSLVTMKVELTIYHGMVIHIRYDF